MPVYPKKIDELKSHFDSIKTKKYWDWERTSSSLFDRGVAKILNFHSSDKKINGFPEYNRDFFTVFSFTRSNHQLNEAINKFWGGIEILNSSSLRERLGKKFDPHYSIGTVGPTIYYATITSMISMMSLFGCISLRGKMKEEDYFLVRKKDDWELLKKRPFITNELKVGKAGSWHENLFFAFQGLKDQKVELPEIDTQQLKELREIREKCHYRFLNDCSMIEDYREVLPEIVDKIPFTQEVIQKNIKLIKSTRYIAKKGLEERFKGLQDNLHLLYQRIKINPKSIIENSDQQKLTHFLE